MQLQQLGWTPQRAEAFVADATSQSFNPARIVRVEGRQATVWTEAGQRRAHLPSRLRKGDGRLVVGDWVAIGSSADGSVRVEQRLPRRTHLVRRAAGRQTRRQLLAANVDVVFIVSSLDRDFSERRLERYLTVVHDGGAQPVILLTKAGLCDDPTSFRERAQNVAPGTDVHAIDVVSGIGTEVPASYMASGTTAVLVGSSGVGKSTLLNHLAGTTQMPTGALRDRDGRGRHTTTHRELFPVAGGVVIDTPGLRELALWADESALDQTFSDVDALARACRFADCSHEHEPGCAVREAVEQGDLDGDRLDSFVSLRHEIETTATQMPEHERRRRGRKFAKLVKQVKRMKHGRR